MTDIDARTPRGRGAGLGPSASGTDRGVGPWDDSKGFAHRTECEEAAGEAEAPEALLVLLEVGGANGPTLRRGVEVTPRAAPRTGAGSISSENKDVHGVSIEHISELGGLCRTYRHDHELE